ncbi:hypothetical protein [Pseudidiomarina terrestris]|uniref:Uncharacterized protein n=1 Tax=Pseudidiomarina terrestris TaxID=2820060 RepID=A0AAW7R416_9GAMM|nr:MULTISPECIES: hypothetical protein [unclassified Pseudidiomarina]MDN7125702.1 hypothetical protein [Pseudidiomarina sp. 1APP75-32.1]MDN7128146.1 hypothetical protein [Pseudidiomarina sp. 1APR75-33.1]MDN7136571.1 hypothetical protein [Pseudidiomarina sp. 1ASP75-5]
MKTESGQAIIESVWILLLLALLLTLIKDVIQPQNIQQQQRIDRSRAEIWRFGLPAQASETGDYAFARQTQKVLGPVAQLTGLKLASDNLRLLTKNEEQVAMARILDAWQAGEPGALSATPALLTPAARLNELGLPQIQRLLSWLHFTEEFAPGQLRWGYVNPDATPLELECAQKRECR